MPREIPQSTFDAAWSVLQSEGVYILHKRDLVIPNPDLGVVSSVVGVRKVRQAYQKFQIFNDFLHMYPIADRFNKDHHARVAWSGVMSKKIGSTVFQRLYEGRNQLRLNILSAPVLALINLCGLINESKQPNVIERLNGIEQQISKVFEGYHPVTNQYDGKKYGDRELEEKLQVVQFMEDRCIDILNVFV